MKLFASIRRFDLLVSLYIFCICVSELMGAKTFPVFTWGTYTLNASVAIFTIPLVFTINDSITEVFGKERTRSVILSGIIVIACLLVFSLLATSLPPSQRFASSEDSYQNVFHLSARISAASLTAFIISEFLDVIVFVKLRKMMGKKGLWLRNNVSNFVSQLTDTIIFMTLAFYSFNTSIGSNITFLLSLSVPYWLLRCFMSVIETPLVYIVAKWLRKEK